MRNKTLYFVKFELSTVREYDTIVFCLTAKDEAEAEAKGRAMIAESCRDSFKLHRVEAICKTPDTVDCFEPV